MNGAAMTKLKFIHAQVNIYAINLHLIAFERCIRIRIPAAVVTKHWPKSNQIRKQSTSGWNRGATPKIPPKNLQQTRDQKQFARRIEI